MSEAVAALGPNQIGLLFGLAFIIVGVGFLKPNISTIVGKLYEDGDPRRDSGFTIFYIGINIGVAAPMAFFPFSGWKASFFGDLHGQGMDAVEFFTQKKVVVERWPDDWSRKF